MKALLIVIGYLALTGCSPSQDGKPWAVQERCIKGVSYYVSGYQLAPAFRIDGTLYVCD